MQIQRIVRNLALGLVCVYAFRLPRLLGPLRVQVHEQDARSLPGEHDRGRLARADPRAGRRPGSGDDRHLALDPAGALNHDSSPFLVENR